jgi:alkanesulfonate monooxygenase SsuD/methylene tetrahydromethanopterin reductase-like flavin-dependent oxidoreductase (luciferase family)
MAFEFGLDTFGERTRDANGLLASHAETLRQVVAQGELADRVGLDFFGVGEHHREEGRRMRLRAERLQLIAHYF